MDKQTLEKYEPKVARLFSNSRKNNRLSGAYLLYGPKNAPLKETALYLAQSLGCENDVLACNECPSCKRFKEGVRPDFYFIDGQEEMIKKGDIQALEKKFSLSAIEKGHTLCYIIHRVENINNEAANALLKFLEEPKVGQVAFLTSYNLDKILPTIRSRSLSVRVDPIHPEQLMEELINQEIVLPGDSKKKENSIHLSPMEAYILSKNYSSFEEVRNKLTTDNTFQPGFAAAEAFLNDYSISYKTGCFTLLKETNGLKDSKCYNWLYLTIQTVFEDALLNLDDNNHPFKEIIQALQNHRDALRQGNETIKEILSHRYLNYNPTLTIARFLDSLDERKLQ